MMFSGNMSPHPIVQLIVQITEPIMGPVRKIIPPMGSIDFSPVFIFLLIGLIRDIIYNSFGVTDQIALVVIGL
jgi:YggT family protein